uniref:5' nucleotidase n=1 Tax=viral metagenome TaxID=1070528 RepID=A0A6M3LT47_9ZZZZ
MLVEVLPEMTIVMPKIDDLFSKDKWLKRICIDIDGCLCEYNFPKIVRDFFGVDLSAQAIFAYDLADVLGVAPSLINTMFKEQVYGKPNFVEGAIATLKEWESNGYELVIYSNRVKYMGYKGLARWLVDWQIPFSGIDEGQSEYDVHIDDSPSKLMATDSKLKLLFRQPWNTRCVNITGKLRRVRSWEEIRDVCSLLDA